MDVPLKLEAREGYLYARFSGTQAVGPFKQAISAIIEECRRAGTNRVLADLSATGGYLDTQSKHDLGVFVAEHAGHKLKVAVLTSPADRNERFFEQVASRHGAFLRDFSEIQDALAWLLGKSQ